MMLWILFALLTLGLALMIMGPLLRSTSQANAPQAENLAVYRDQLAELAREAEIGRIGPAEAEAAKAEISRRLLAAADEAPAIQAEKPKLNKWIAIGTGLLLPFLAVGIYAYEGRPDLSGKPQAERLANAEAAGDFDALVFKVQRHLRANPQDQQGWQVLIRALTDLKRYEQAAEAWRGYIKVAPATADNLAGFGEALVLANQGMMTDEAEKAFAEALKIDATHPMSRFFQGLSARQKGDSATAIAIWQKLYDEAPDNAPWKQAVANSIENAKSSATPPMANADGVDASMIRGMVEGLAARLAENGDDLEGWLRLARSRQVLGEMDLAKQALDQAEANFKNDPQAMARITDARANLETAQ